MDFLIYAAQVKQTNKKAKIYNHCKIITCDIVTDISKNLLQKGMKSIFNNFRDNMNTTKQ